METAALLLQALTDGRRDGNLRNAGQKPPHKPAHAWRAELVLHLEPPASRTFAGTVTLTAYDLAGDGTGRPFLERSVSLPAGPGAIEWFGLPDGAMLPPGNTTATICTVTDEVGALASEHLVQLVTPEHLCVPVADVSFTIAGSANADGTIEIAVTSDKVALWVTLTSAAHGRFSDNAFFLPATTKAVQFVPFSNSTTAAEDLAALEQSLRVEDLSMYRSLSCE